VDVVERALASRPIDDPSAGSLLRVIGFLQPL
jgi:hypothetical protein